MAAISKINQSKKCIILNRGQTRPFQGDYRNRWLTEGSKVTSVNIWIKSFRRREKISIKNSR